MSASAYAMVGDARFSAVKAARILMGETPADLPVEYLGEPGIVVNEQTARACRVSLPRWMYNESRGNEIAWCSGDGLGDAI